jgi:probable phosphomutase (TIGR03848 family)
MPLVIFVRHGENDYVKKGRLAGRLQGIHLNNKGKAQAQRAAEVLCNMLAKSPPKAVYSSPLERTLETADPIARAFGLETILRDGLIETNFGEWQDKSVKQLSRLKVWKTVQNCPSIFRFPEGESFAESQHRITGEVQALVSQHDPKDSFICVSHSDPIKLAIAYFLGLPLDMFQRLVVSPASITIFQISPTGAQLITMNYDPMYSLAKT